MSLKITFVYNSGKHTFTFEHGQTYTQDNLPELSTLLTDKVIRILSMMAKARYQPLPKYEDVIIQVTEYHPVLAIGG